MSGFPGRELVEEPVVLSDGTALTADMFYAQRDQRTRISVPLPIEPIRSVLALPDLGSKTEGAHTALLWTGSMLRRMGRAFAETRIACTQGARTQLYRGTLLRALGRITLEEAITAELLGADPFACLEWAALDGPDAFADARAIIWFGGRGSVPVASPALIEITVRAHGWVAAVEIDTRTGDRLSSGALPAEDLVEMDAAPAAIIGACSLAVAAMYRITVSSPSTASDLRADRVWWSLESGRVTTQSDEGRSWFANGHAARVAAPWRPEAGADAVQLGRVTIVSAGALGGNAAQILAATHAETPFVRIIDPDGVEVSNLNRLIGVHLSDVKAPKAQVAVAALQAVGIDAKAETARYEEWAASCEGDCHATNDSVLVGVDQVATRLEVQANWPRLLINGGTSGTGWSVGSHILARGGCVGCYYGQSHRTYAEARAPVACAAGVAVPGPQQPAHFASYPFSSVSAAAAMIAALVDINWREKLESTAFQGSNLLRLNSTSPEYAALSELDRDQRCRLLCGNPEVAQLLVARRIGFATGRGRSPKADVNQP